MQVKNNKLNVVQDKVVTDLQVNRRPKAILSHLRNQTYLRINKTTRTLFRSQKAVLVDTCHDVDDLSYDNE